MDDGVGSVQFLADEQVVAGVLQPSFGDAQAAGGDPLRVDVQHQDLLIAHRQAGSQIDVRGRLADAAFLIEDCDCFSHILLISP